MLYIRWSKNHHEMTKLGALPYYTTNYVLLALTRKICGTLSKNLQKLA